MTEVREDQAQNFAILRQMVDELAMQLVLGGEANRPAWLEQVLGSLDKLRLGAEIIENADLMGVAQQLKQQAVQLQGGDGDLVKLEAGLRRGISRFEAALSGESAVAHPAQTQGTAIEESNALARDPELIADFIMESREHLASIEGQLLALEQNPDDREPIHSIFRGFHTIKGLAGFLELAAMQAVAHEVETLLDLARNGKLAFTAGVIDVVLASGDYLGGELGRVERGLRGGEPEASADNQALLVAVRGLMRPAPGAAAPPAPAATAAASPSASQALGDLSQAMDGIETPGPEVEAKSSAEAKTEKRTQAGEVRSVRVNTTKLDNLVDMVGEMVIAESMIRHNPEMAQVNTPKLLRNFSQLESITDQIQKTAMSMRMVPVGVLFQKMARLVRDLSRKHGKQVDFETSGEDTELDRNIVEELADPLMHMVRNAIDHGIEIPETRRAAGKNPAAKVLLRAFHQAGHIAIQISDDGRGLNREKILAKARQKGLIDASQHLSDNEIFNLILEPGFSTADQVTDISGRGVGMDVVRKKVQQLRGRIEIQSVEGQGTTFILKLPLTLAIIDGLVVGVGQERYIVPVFAVKEMLRPTADTIFTVENREEMALVRGHLFPVVRLYKRFQVVPRSEDPTASVLVIAECNGKDFCLMVDELIGKQEVVIKSLGESLKNVPGVAGGAILGDGRVGLILDMKGLYGKA